MSDASGRTYVQFSKGGVWHVEAPTMPRSLDVRFAFTECSRNGCEFERETWVTPGRICKTCSHSVAATNDNAW